MEGRDVREADDPFGIAAQVEAGESVHGVDETVAAARADDGADLRVGEGFFKVVETLVGRAAVVAALAEGVGHDDGLPALFAESLDSLLDIDGLDGAGGRTECYLIALLKRAGEQ